MFGVVFIGIVVSMLVLGIILVSLFVDVARAGPPSIRKRTLPLLAGDSLKAWAAARGRCATNEWLASDPERSHGNQLARGIEGETGALLEQAIFEESAATRGVQPCQDGTRVPRATAPEVFAIATELRKLPIIGRIRLKRRVGAAATTDSAACPLLNTDGMCLCADARPLECRGRCLAGFDCSPDAMKWASSLEDGMLEGLQQELENAGLDGRRYDLNAALATVLTDPDAEARWQRGERLLSGNAEAITCA